MPHPVDVRQHQAVRARLVERRQRDAAAIGTLDVLRNAWWRGSTGVHDVLGSSHLPSRLDHLAWDIREVDAEGCGRGARSADPSDELEAEAAADAAGIQMRPVLPEDVHVGGGAST